MFYVVADIIYAYDLSIALIHVFIMIEIVTRRPSVKQFIEL